MCAGLAQRDYEHFLWEVKHPHHQDFSLTNLSQVQQAIRVYGNKILPSFNHAPIQVQVKLGDLVLLKIKKAGSTINQQNLTRKGPSRALLTAPMAVKRQGITRLYTYPG